MESRLPQPQLKPGTPNMQIVPSRSKQLQQKKAAPAEEYRRSNTSVESAKKGSELTPCAPPAGPRNRSISKSAFLLWRSALPWAAQTHRCLRRDSPHRLL